jgi:PhzF family phenazine biosynthesis protein
MRAFELVDVFGAEPFLGNPLAVVHAAEGLGAEEMQRITRWLNLSETVFLLPPERPGADYRARIFTLERELPFAGHPTLGACHAWLRAGGEAKGGAVIVQECGIGAVTIRRDGGGQLAFAAPPVIRTGPVDAAELDAALRVLRLAPEQVVEARWIDNGPGWMGVMLASSAEVLAVEPQASVERRLDVGLVGPCPAGSDIAYEIRALFADHLGVLREDPVTGSLNAAVGQWLYDSGRRREGYIAAQGRRVGSDGRITVSYDGEGRTWVGGATRTMFAGHCL